MKMHWAVSVVVAVGLSALGCGKSDGERMMEEAAQKVEAANQQAQAKADAAMADAAKIMDQAAEQTKDATKAIENVGADAASALEQLKDGAE